MAQPVNGSSPDPAHNAWEAPIPCADVREQRHSRTICSILGDSIAEGLGDHLMRVVVERNPRYAVAHHLQDKIGRDVISFGVRGDYPSDTYVFQSHRNWDGINIYAGIALEQPKDIVVLYSEGTDINDEMANIRFWLPADIDRSRLMDTDYVAKLMTRYVADGKKLARRRWHAGRNGHMFDTIMKLTNYLFTT